MLTQVGKRVVKPFLLGLIKAYQFFLSPWIGSQCRFHPTCSEYARLAIELHGPLKGSYLALRRLLRCHPYSGRHGFDPVPGSDQAQDDPPESQWQKRD